MSSCSFLHVNSSVHTHTPLFYTLTHTLSHTGAFTHRRFYTQTLLHTEAFTHRRFYTQTLLHTEAFTHRRFHTQRLLHTEAFTHKRFYTQTPLPTDAFTHTCSETRFSFTPRLWPYNDNVFLTSVAQWLFMVLNSNFSVFDIKHMMASSSVANACRHFTSEVLSHVWFTASWYRSFWGFSIIKWNNMCHTQHHGTELFWAIYVGFSIIKWNNMCHTRHHGTEIFW